MPGDPLPRTDPAIPETEQMVQSIPIDLAGGTIGFIMNPAETTADYIVESIENMEHQEINDNTVADLMDLDDMIQRSTKLIVDMSDVKPKYYGLNITIVQDESWIGKLISEKK